MSRGRPCSVLLLLIGAALIALTVGTGVAIGETNEQILSRRPLAPTNRAMFSTSVYPETPAMQPATGGALSETQARALLVSYEQAELPGNTAGQNAALAFYDSAAAKAKVPNHSLRAALAALEGTFAQGAMNSFINDVTPASNPKWTSVAFGPAAQVQPGVARVFSAGTGDPNQLKVVFTERYQFEYPFLFTTLMAHEVLHSDLTVNNVEEANDSSFDNLLGIRELAGHPGQATLGTELSRRINTRALELLNSGLGSQLGLYATNGNRQLFPGSSVVPARSWWEDADDGSGGTTPGSSLLGSYLTNTHSSGAPTCSSANFSKPLLDCIDANRNRGLTSSELVAAARALRLNLSPPTTGGGSGSGGGGAVDLTPPIEKLSGKKTQKLGKTVVVTVSCSEACTATATGTLSVPKFAKVYRLKKATRSIRASAKIKLKLKLSKKARKAAKRALKRHKHVKTKIKVTVVDAHGSKTSKKRTIKLKLR